MSSFAARTILALALLVVTGDAARVELVSYDGAGDTVALSEFTCLNDPVMGGKSSGTYTVDDDALAGVLDGEVVDVPSLSAPGFITAVAYGAFADASAATAEGSLVLTLRSTTPEFTGFKVSFAAGAASPSYSCAGGGSLPFSRGCFKAPFTAPEGDDFTEVRVPFSSFTDLWSSATGEPTSTCDEDQSACVTTELLASIQSVELWAEGADGPVHVELAAVAAELAEAATAAAATAAVGVSPPAEFELCSGPVQTALRFGIAHRTTPAGVYTNPAVDQNESLAEAVCCDSRTLATAEPMYTYAAPDISLFTRLDANGTTTFYDSVCGVPLFRAPVNRSFAEFQADTDEHGWPSFRGAEIFRENLVGGGVDDDSSAEQVFSSCGTHIGSFLPDEEGDRWCIDLSCIAGNPVEA